MQSRGFEIRFSCAHFYRQRRWNEERNRDTFGKCFDPHGHGHDYRLLAEFPNLGDPGAALAALKELRETLDHHHLNHSIPEFADQVPTSENLLLYCLDRLQRRLGKGTKMRLELWETPEIGASLTSP